MDSDELEELTRQAAQVARLALAAFEGLSGEPLALDRAIRRYPVLLLSVAVGVGATAGWWLGRKGAKQLPPRAASPLEYLDRVMPALDKARELLPSEEEATTWLDTVVEPRLREGLETLSGGTGHALNDVFRRIRGASDHELADPEDEADGARGTSNSA